MAAIQKTFGSGLSGIAPGGSAGNPDLATILRDIAADLAGTKTASAAAAALVAESSTDIAAVAASAPIAEATVDGSDPASTQALVNSLKAKYNTMVTAVVELRTLAATVRTLANSLKAGHNLAVILVNQIRTSINAGGVYTLKTTAP